MPKAAQSSTEQVHAAVNDPANAGATLVPAPGTYVLSASDPSGLPRPNGGRLEMQHDMSMRGIEGDRSAVVIDAFALPASSFPASSRRRSTSFRRATGSMTTAAGRL